MNNSANNIIRFKTGVRIDWDTEGGKNILGTLKLEH